MAETEKPRVDRRNFLKTAAITGAASLLVPAVTGQDTSTEVPAANVAPGDSNDMTTDRPGADFMVDVIKSLGFEYVCGNPGSSIRGLYESIVNYGGNKNPQWILCTHEESAIAMCHGYAKIEGKPLLVCLHGTVGLQHAAMALYNAWCDRAPVYAIVGNVLDATVRRPALDPEHSAQDPIAMVRDYIKWDDQPTTLQGFAESAVRGYRLAMNPPTLPVMLSADFHIQEDPVPKGMQLRIPKLTLPQPPQGDSGSVAEAARLLVRAENPVIVAERVGRTEAGMKGLIELAEILQAPVIDQLGRMNFPSRHPLNQTQRSVSLLGDADVVLGLELQDYWGTVNLFTDQLVRTTTPLIKPDTRLIHITTEDLYMKSNYQEMHRFREVDLEMSADAETTLPSLIEAVKRELTSDRKRTFADRGAKFAKARKEDLDQAYVDATYGWDASPISVARLHAEIWNQIKDEDWSFVSFSKYLSRWSQRLWDFDKHYQFIGGSGGLGMGYNAPAAVGAALANRRYGRLTVNIQADGDLMYAPGVLWTATHNRIPMLNIMHNNRAYHAESMQFQILAGRHNRGIENAPLVTGISDPNIDYSKLAQSMGVYAEGPITDPKDLGPAIRRAIAAVKKGEPALVDAVCQGR